MKNLKIAFLPVLISSSLLMGGMNCLQNENAQPTPPAEQETPAKAEAENKAPEKTEESPKSSEAPAQEAENNQQALVDEAAAKAAAKQAEEEAEQKRLAQEEAEKAAQQANAEQVAAAAAALEKQQKELAKQEAKKAAQKSEAIAAFEDLLKLHNATTLDKTTFASTEKTNCCRKIKIAVDSNYLTEADLVAMLTQKNLNEPHAKEFVKTCLAVGGGQSTIKKLGDTSLSLFGGGVNSKTQNSTK